MKYGLPAKVHNVNGFDIIGLIENKDCHSINKIFSGLNGTSRFMKPKKNHPINRGGIYIANLT
jgi:hypothetical protein